MSHYLLVESRDPFEGGDVADDFSLARELARGGHETAVLLVQNAVLAARSGARVEGLDELQRDSVRVLADSFSLRERGIAAADLRSGIQARELDVILDAMTDGHKVMWL